MNQLYQIFGSGDLKANANAAFKMAEKGPGVILSRTQPKAGMVSPEQWNATSAYIALLEKIIENDRRSREMDSDPPKRVPFTLEEHIKRGLIDG